MRWIFKFKRLPFKRIGIWFGCGISPAFWYGLSWNKEIEFEILVNLRPRFNWYILDYHDACGRCATLKLGFIEFSVTK
jgi:hypothetical protein